RFGHRDQLSGGVVVQHAGAACIVFVDQSAAQIIGPGVPTGGAIGFDELAGVVVGIGSDAVGAVDLGDAAVHIGGDAGAGDVQGVGQGVDHRMSVIIVPGVELLAGAGSDDAPGGVGCNVDLVQGGVGDLGDAPEHVGVVFATRTVGVDQ